MEKKKRESKPKAYKTDPTWRVDRFFSTIAQVVVRLGVGVKLDPNEKRK